MPLKLVPPIFKGFSLIPWGGGEWAKGALAPGPCGPVSPLVHTGPSGIGGPHNGTFQNLLELSDTIPKNPELFRNPKKYFPIYNSLSPNHYKAPREVLDPIRDSEQNSVSPLLIISFSTLASTNVKCVTLRVREHVIG